MHRQLSWVPFCTESVLVLDCRRLQSFVFLILEYVFRVTEKGILKCITYNIDADINKKVSELDFLALHKLLRRIT
jgi:hypothetical protein